MARPKAVQRLCIIRTTSGRDYHFPLAEGADGEGYLLTRRSDSVQLVKTDGSEKMVFYKDNVEVLRIEEGVDDGSAGVWRDPVM